MAHPSDHESRILEAFAQNSPGPVVRERLAEALRWDPDAVGRAFRYSYDERDSLHAWNDDAFRPIAVALKDMLQDEEYLKDHAIWEGIVQSDICDAYTETIYREETFDEDEEVFTAIYEGFAGIVMGACVWDENDYVTLSARCEALWQYLWEHRARLSASGHTTLRGIVCLVGVFTHVNKLRESPVIPNYLPYVGLYMFVYVEDADENMLELMVPFLMIYDDETGEDPSPSFIRTFQEAIMDDLEGNLFFTRLNMVLEMQTLGVLQGGDNDVLEQRKLDGLHSCVETLLLITSVRNIFPLLESWEMLPNVLRISQTLRGRMPVYLYEPIVSFLSECLDALLHPEPENTFGAVPGRESLSFIARGLEQVSVPGGAILEGRSVEMFCEALKQFIVIVQGVDAHRSYRSVSAGIAVSAREVWWPTLRLLQQATSSRSTPEAAEQIRLLLGSWTALGAALNLDVAAERQRHERDARRRCAWRECQFHQQALPQNMHTELRTCSGCHDIRYCSRRCQKRDWSQGGHRIQCRRLM